MAAAATNTKKRALGYSGSNALRESKLSVNERRYLFSVDSGNFAAAKAYVEYAEELDININCVDPWGRNPLVISIENDNIPLLKMLLENKLKFGDALLHAIESEHIQAIEVMLAVTQNGDQTKRNKLAEVLGESTSASFSSDITPLILACHVDNYQIVRILLEMGFTIPTPHHVNCGCIVCVRERREDGLKHSIHRYNAFKALASPSLICLTSKDPIMTAFELSFHMDLLSTLEFEFKQQYEELASKVRAFAVDLLNQTRGSMELHVILNHESGGKHDSLMNHLEWDHQLETYVVKEAKLTRLKLAIAYEQRMFVANPRCQHTLSSLWFEGLRGFRQMSTMNQLSMSMMISALTPLLVALHILIPNSKLGRFITHPYVKFLCHTASYFLLLLILIAESIRVEELIEHKGANVQHRAPMPSIAEYVLLIYVLGWIVHEASVLYRVGHRAFLANNWNILNMTALSFFALWFSLRVGALVELNWEASHDYESAEDREEWNGWDPTIVAEGAFTVATIIVFLRILHLFTIFQFLGPLQMAIGKVLLDIGKFFILYFWVVFAFACGISQMYWYYAALYGQKCEDGTYTDPLCWRLQQNWGDIFNIFQTLYWFLLNHVKMQNLWVYDGLSFSNFLVKLLFGIYRCIAHVVLVTLLIAMMNHSYSLSMGGFGPEDMGEEEKEEEEIVEKTLERIEEEQEEEASEHTMTLTEKLLRKLKEGSEQSDMNWKFARAKMFLRYAEVGNNLPIPFNLIPHPVYYINLLVDFAKEVLGLEGEHDMCFEERMNMLHRKRIAIDERQQQYEAVMSRLIKRYLIRKQKLESHRAVHENDFNELKQGINSFRFDMMEILRSNRFIITDDLVRRQGNRLRRRKQRAQGVAVTKVNPNVIVVEHDVEGDADSQSQDGEFSRAASTRGSNRRTRLDFMEEQLNTELTKLKQHKDQKLERRKSKYDKKHVTFNADASAEHPKTSH